MEIRWDRLLGHERRIAQARRMIEERRLPHALLLFGPEGVGKRRVAETMAAALLCAGEDAPCGECESCRAARLGTHPDFYLVEPEAQGKSARAIRIDRIRALQAGLARLPILSGRSVVLMDDAHLMNEAAANCLLKTLEEPTGDTVFLLVTSARSSLLPTILSRCVPVAFGMLPDDVIKRALEDRGVAGAKAVQIAALVDGSLGRAIRLAEGDGLSMQEEAVAFLEQMGSLSMEQVFARGEELGSMARERLIEWLRWQIVLFRDLALLRSDGGSPLIYCRGARDRLLALLPGFSESRIFDMIGLLQETQRRMRENVNLRLQLESCLIKWMGLLQA